MRSTLLDILMTTTKQTSTNSRANKLASAGLDWYEISNFARPGHECRHNLLYWRQGEYFGIGCAAHSHRAGRRWWNVRTPERYIEAIEGGRSCEASDEHLDDKRRELERLQLALRTRDGVPLDRLSVDDLDGLIEVHGDRAVLTVRGRLLANEVALRLRLHGNGMGGSSITWPTKSRSGLGSGLAATTARQ